MTNSLSVSANDVKLAILYNERFMYQSILTVTEAGQYSADVLVLNKQKELIEFEIKISVTDLKADFRKYQKHIRYRQSINETNEDNIQFVPHYFYFVIPETLLSEAYSIFAKYPDYGVMVFKNKPLVLTENNIDTTGFLHTIRRPKLLRTMKTTNDEIFRLQKRASSELIREKVKHKLRG